MKNSSSNFWDKNFILPLKEVVVRFPFSLASFAILTGIFSYFILTDSKIEFQQFLLLLSFSIAGILGIAGQLLYEKYQKKFLYGIYPLIVIYSVGFYFLGNNFHNDDFLLLVMQILGFLAFPFWISYSYQEKTEFRYYNFFREISLSIFIGGFVGIVLSILGLIALTSIRSLFDLSYDFEKLLPIWMMLSFVIFGITYGLSRFPKYIQTTDQEYISDKFSSFVIRWILVPFVLIYFTILYAYSIKVLLNFSNWPKGIIASMVMGFSILGYLAYILTKGFEKISFIAIFRKILPFAVLLQLPMLFYAIYLRISQYGLTTNRYIIVLSGIILLGISLYYIISQNKKLVTIPLVFSVFTLIFSVGPWNIQRLPETLQFKNFKKNIETLGLFKDGKFTKFDENIHDINVKNKIIGQLEYLCNYKNKCQKLKPYFGDAIPEKSQYHNGEMTHWEIKEFLQEKMNINENLGENPFFGNTNTTNNDYIRRYFLYKNQSFFTHIDGYQYQIDLLNPTPDIQNSVENFVWKITINNTKIGEFNIKNYLDSILSAHTITGHNTFIDIPPFEAENEDYKIKFIPEHIPLDYKTNDDYFYGNYMMEGKLLLIDKNNKIRE